MAEIISKITIGYKRWFAFNKWHLFDNPSNIYLKFSNNTQEVHSNLDHALYDYLPNSLIILGVSYADGALSIDDGSNAVANNNIVLLRRDIRKYLK